MPSQGDEADGWYKSTKSEPASCVEIRVGPTFVWLRDSKDRNGPVLRFNHTEWRAFLDGAAKGEFDLPAE